MMIEALLRPDAGASLLEDPTPLSLPLRRICTPWSMSRQLCIVAFAVSTFDAGYLVVPVLSNFDP